MGRLEKVCRGKRNALAKVNSADFVMLEGVLEGGRSASF